MFGEDIVQEIDKTLDQLICNAEVISSVDLSDLTESELDAFQKTQESLLQRLMHMDERLAAQRQRSKQPAQIHLREKLFRFEELKSDYSQKISQRRSGCAIRCKRRAKRFFDLRSRKGSRSFASQEV
jgi:hypothetical protein